MSELIESFKLFFLVATGAITGSVFRMYLTDFFYMLLPAKHWGTMIVNILAAFILGLLLAYQSSLELESAFTSSSLFLFFSVGFLGSMSTFSTFVTDLFNTLRANQWKEFFCLALFSLVGGLLAVTVGFFLVDV